MHIELPDPLRHFVQTAVASARYGSESEVICDALRRLEESNALQALKLEQLRTAVTEGLESELIDEEIDIEAVIIRARQAGARPQ